MLDSFMVWRDELNFLKKVINNLLLIFGHHIVRTDCDKNSPVFQNLQHFVITYEYLFQKYRNNKMIPANTIRAELITRLLGTSPSEAYFIVEAITKTNLIKGDICEFGVAQGETSAFMANEIRESDKRLHLFDSFEGLPKPTAKDRLKDDFYSLGSIVKYEGTMKCNEKLVIHRLKEISFDPEKYFIHKGFIEKLIHEDMNLPEKVSFAYIDFDFYEPILVALNFLHDVTPEGGIFIIDDYDFFSTGVKTAVDEFIKDKNHIEKYYDVEIPNKRFGCFAILSKIK
jgi:O-methyltransferase